MHTEKMSHARDGQAMIELVIALVAMVTLVAGLLLIADLGMAQTRTMVEARREAGRLALQYLPVVSQPEYILDWNEGLDGKPLTHDDEPLKDSHIPFNNLIVDMSAADEDQWPVLDSATNSLLPGLRNHWDPVSVFGLVRGYESETVPLMSAVQSLFYRADEIEIESEVWMGYTRGIY